MMLTVLDAGVLVGFLDSHDSHHSRSRAALAGAIDSEARLVMPEPTYEEVLRGPAGGRGVDALLVEQVVESMPIEVVPLDAETEQHATQLCAEHVGLQMSSAVVIATAASIGAEVLLTTNPEWPGGEELGVAVEVRVV